MQAAVREMSILLLLLTLCLCHSHASQDELFRLRLYPGQDLVLTTHSNPCTELLRYCAQLSTTTSTNPPSISRCVQDYQPKLQQELITFHHFMKELNTDERLFMRCDDLIPVYTDTNFSDFYWEMLHLLQSGPSGSVQVLEEFEARRNEMRMSESESMALYQRAILLHPNSTMVLAKFGFVLQDFGHTHLADSLWENTVARGLWPSVLQRPEWHYVPEIPPKAWHDPRDYPFAAKLETGAASIRRELLYNLEHNHQAVVREDIINRNAVLDNQWTVIKLIQQSSISPNTNYTKYSEFFPETMRILKDCGVDFILVKFSAIAPGTHIKAHTGPSNDRLRVHLGLLHTGGARLRVGTEWRYWEEGKVMMFDSSWEHEVYHDGKDVRIVLIADVWIHNLV